MLFYNIDDNEKYFKYIWQFVSFLFVPQMGRHTKNQIRGK